jgi:hypothetical protein
MSDDDSAFEAPTVERESSSSDESPVKENLLRAKLVLKPNSLLTDFEVLTEKENNAAAVMSPPKKRRPNYKRDRNLVAPFDPVKLLLSNEYNLPLDAAGGFAVGDKVCVKDWYEGTQKCTVTD